MTQIGMPMELKLDLDKFDEYQIEFIKEIIQTIRLKLAEAGMEGDDLENTTARVAFGVASIIDDTTQIGDGDVKPFLAFQGDKEGELIHCGENSCTYEFVTPAMEDVFDIK